MTTSSSGRSRAYHKADFLFSKRDQKNIPQNPQIELAVLTREVVHQTVGTHKLIELAKKRSVRVNTNTLPSA